VAGERHFEEAAAEPRIAVKRLDLVAEESLFETTFRSCRDTKTADAVDAFPLFCAALGADCSSATAFCAKDYTVPGIDLTVWLHLVPSLEDELETSSFPEADLGNLHPVLLTPLECSTAPPVPAGAEPCSCANCKPSCPAS
jgi:hypothetical protein